MVKRAFTVAKGLQMSVDVSGPIEAVGGGSFRRITVGVELISGSPGPGGQQRERSRKPETFAWAEPYDDVRALVLGWVEREGRKLLDASAFSHRKFDPAYDAAIENSVGAYLDALITDEHKPPAA